MDGVIRLDNVLLIVKYLCPSLITNPVYGWAAYALYVTIMVNLGIERS